MNKNNNNQSNEELVNRVDDAREEDVAQDEAVKETPRTIKGEVANCARLNVRKTRKLSAKVLTIIQKGDIVTVHTEDSTNEWLSVSTESGVDGFCMKKYIAVKES